MALNSSGPISIGGSTAGQSINLEIQRNATDTTILSSYTPKRLAGITGNQISFSDFYGKTFIPYFGNRLTEPSGVYNAVAVDSSGNIYVCGTLNTGPAGLNDIILAKYDSSGNILWQKCLGTTVSFNDTGKGIAVDSSGNVYICGETSTGTAGGTVAKYNTNGTLQWYRRITATSTAITFNDIAVDSSGNSYVTGKYGGSWAIVAKFDTSGTLQFRTVYSCSNSIEGRGITLDSSANFYITGEIRNSAYSPEYPSDLFVSKFNSSGTHQWTKCQGTDDGTSWDYGYKITTDSTYVYVSGVCDQTGLLTNDARGFLAKFECSGGTLTFQRNFYSATRSYIGFSIALNSSGHIFVVSTYNSGGSGVYGTYSKWIGTSWQYSVAFFNRPSTPSSQIIDIVISSTGDLIMVGECDGRPIVLKVPDNANLYENFTDFGFASWVYNENAASTTSITRSLTSQTVTTNTNTGGYFDTSTSYTASRLPF